MNRDRLGVALTKCYFCLGDNYIVMNSLLRNSIATEVEKMHKKVVDMTPCSECEEYMKQGVILITIDSKRSSKDWDKQEIPNPYRTGGWFVITDEAIKRIFPEEHAKFALEHRFMFIEHEVAVMIGLFEQNCK